MMKIVCLGDSLTEGFGVDNGECWVDLLREELNIPIINSGISGDTTGGMLARFQTMVVAHAPTHVIIMGGTNDLWLNLSDEQLLSNILAMTRYARHHNIKTIIGIPTPIFYDDIVEENSIYLDLAQLSERRLKYVKKLVAFATTESFPVIDFLWNMTVDLFSYDGVHPNALGHQMMKENAKKVITTFL